MNSETRNCQNCKSDFIIEPDDFDFYKKMEVPPPTFCPQCRLVRRLMWRNDRTLHHRSCALCGKNVLTIYAPEKTFNVYCQPCWYSDKWDPMDFGVEYDPTRTFLDQFRELHRRVPLPALTNGYTTLVNSEYVSETGSSKNCYLIFNSDYNENCLYCFTVDHSKDSMEAYILESSELTYETINCEKCYQTYFSEDCISCTDVYFSKNLSGCSHCFGCVNLRNKKYHIWNEPYSKEEYEARLEAFDLGSAVSIEGLRRRARSFWLKYPHKFMQGTHNVNASGDYVWESKNARNMYQARGVELGRYSQFMTIGPAKDIYDLTQWGEGAQRVCDAMGAGLGADMVRFSYGVWSDSRNVEYSVLAINGSSDILGGVALRNKKYCILNREYPPEKFRELRTRIIKDMSENPYIDAKGRIFRYGEFFPYDLSPYSYNETTAAEFFPLSKEDILSRGWSYREPEASKHAVTMPAPPDNIRDVEDGIVKEVLACEECRRPFRIVQMELNLLRRFGLPLPRNCQDCRHRARIARINPPRLWDRQCAKCGKDIKTSYAPDRSEIVYCEECYQNEVA